MALLTFTPPLRPSVGSGEAHAPRVLTADFGDGYTQRAADGINNDPVAWKLRWNLLTIPQKDAINGFLAARRGYEAFWWTPPGESAPRKFVCRQWNSDAVDGLLWSLAASFTEVFDL